MLPKGITGFYDRTQSPPPMLEEAEMAQIRDWNPRTVGEILFNFWD